MKNTRFTVKMSEQDAEKLKKQADEKEMTRSEYVRYLIYKNE